jgi:hypothetical protein
MSRRPSEIFARREGASIVSSALSRPITERLTFNNGCKPPGRMTKRAARFSELRCEVGTSAPERSSPRSPETLFAGWTVLELTGNGITINGYVEPCSFGGAETIHLEVGDGPRGAESLAAALEFAAATIRRQMEENRNRLQARKGDA